MQGRVLILEDNYDTAEALKKEAVNVGFDPGYVYIANNLTSAASLLAIHKGFDVLIIDLLLGEDEDFEAGLKLLENEGLLVTSTRIIIYSGNVHRIKIPNGLQKRAQVLFLKKPLDKPILRETLKECARISRERYPAEIVVSSQADREIHNLLPWIACTDLPVLITGPTGSGKESTAWVIARKSSKHNSSIKAINCGALTETLLMSELFGHVKGAFTGADRHRLGLVLEASGYEHLDSMGGDKTGRIKPYHEWLSKKGSNRNPIKTQLKYGEECYRLPENINGGTLILDEVAELSVEAQAAMLRVLDGLPIKPVGYDGPGFLPNLRIISITNDTKKIFDEKRFRKDLLARINGWHITIESLSKRPETARKIIESQLHEMNFWDEEGIQTKKQFKVQSTALNILVAESGKLPGGIRELKWWVKRACVFAFMEGTETIQKRHIEIARQSEIAWSRASESVSIEEQLKENDFSQDIKILRQNVQKIFAEHGQRLPQSWISDDIRNSIKDLIQNQQMDAVNKVRELFSSYSGSKSKYRKELLVEAIRLRSTSTLSAKLATIRGWFR